MVLTELLAYLLGRLFAQRQERKDQLTPCSHATRFALDELHARQHVQIALHGFRSLGGVGLRQTRSKSRDFTDIRPVVAQAEIEREVTLAHVARIRFALEKLMHVVAPGDVPLLLPNECKLGPESVHQAAHGIAQKRQEVAPGLAGTIQLPVVVGARFIVVIAQEVAAGDGMPADMSR